MDLYDFIVPTASVCSLAAVFLGPIYFPKVYVCFLSICFVSYFFMAVTHLLKFRSTVAKIKAHIATKGEAERRGLLESSYTHMFIIPNYGEPLALLQNTLWRLAEHSSARQSYVIVLAMEASEAGNELKSKMLDNEFRSQFKDFIVTVHPEGISGEAMGKGSNGTSGLLLWVM
jgi:hypothetical protein